MSNFTGFASAALQMGVSSLITIRKKRGLFNPILPDGTSLPDIVAQATIEEDHHDELEITEHPVEQGAAIADHAFKRPAEVTIKMGWSNSPSGPASMVNAALGAAVANNGTVQRVANAFEIGAGALSILNGSGSDQVRAIYQQLLELQASRALFDVYTGKRVYTNMVCKSLAVNNDFKTENSLFVTMTCKQLILVNTQTVTFPQGTQADPKATASPVDKGTKSLQPVSSNVSAGGNLPPGGFH